LNILQQPEKKPRIFSRKLLSITAFISALVTGGFIYMNSGMDSFDQVKYNQGIMEFTENENIALRIYSHMEEEQLEIIPYFIEEAGLPSWNRNIEIIFSLNSMENLPEDLKSQNQILLDYCHLRIQAYGLMRKKIEEKSSGYDSQIEIIHLEIQKLMDEMEDQAVVYGN
jgi:rhomboid protease GluP